MRIGIDAREFGGRTTGIARWTANAIEGGVALGRRDEIVAFVGSNGARARLPFRAEAVAVGGPGAWVDLVGLGRAAGAARLDAFLSPYYKIPTGLRVPAVAVVHDLIPLEWADPARRAWFADRLRASLSRAARVATVSRHVAARLADFGLAEDRLVLAPNAVAPIFRPRPIEWETPRLLRFHLRPGGYVLCVSDDRPHKNLARLVEAWFASGLGEEGLRLAVTAEPSTSDRLLGAAARLRLAVEIAARAASRPPARPGIVLLGAVGDADLAALYAGARAVVVPSFDEGFGLPLIEAMATGTPVAAAEAGAIPETAAGAALLFDPRSVGGISWALRRVVEDEDLRAELRRKGLARAASFTPAEAARPLWEALDEIA